MSKITGIKTILFLVLIVFAHSCYEPTTDCLDVLATNYEVESDDSCNDCCEYPQLTLSIDHVMNDSLDFEEDSIYLTKSNQEYSLSNLQYLIRHFRLIDENDTPYGVEEMIILKDDLDTDFEIEDNFAYVKTDGSSYKIGTFIKPGIYKGIRFLVGLDPAVNHSNFEVLDNDHELNQAADSLHIDMVQGFRFVKLKLVSDPTNSNEEFDINILEEDGLIVVELDHDFTAGIGDNITINIQADYSKWFNNLNLEEVNLEGLKENIVSFGASAFSVVD